MTAAELAAAKADLSRLDIGWALVWAPRSHVNPPVDAYLRATGFRFDYRTDRALVFKYPGG